MFLNNFFLLLSSIIEEYDELGRLQRTCDGEVTVNKCEGYCNSQVQPSVITPTGMKQQKLVIIHLNCIFSACIRFSQRMLLLPWVVYEGQTRHLITLLWSRRSSLDISWFVFHGYTLEGNFNLEFVRFINVTIFF